MGEKYKTGYNDPAYLNASVLGMPVSASDQKITISGTSAQSTALTDGRLYSVISDTDCHLAIGTNPTATTSHYWLPAGQERVFIANEASVKIAVIQNAVAGNLYISLLDGVGEN